jgi:hypothetical protein
MIFIVTIGIFSYVSFSQVELNAVSELNIYFHSPGQILRTSHINRLSTANRKNVNIAIWSSAIFLDWEVTLDIDVTDFNEVQGADCIEIQQSYDHCIISKFLEHTNNSIFSPLFLPGNTTDWPANSSGAPLDIIKELNGVLIHQETVSQCAKSCMHFQVQFEQKAKRDYIEV